MNKNISVEGVKIEESPAVVLAWALIIHMGLNPGLTSEQVDEFLHMKTDDEDLIKRAKNIKATIINTLYSLRKQREEGNGF